MTHPLLQRLFDRYGYPRITRATHDEFVRRDGVGVLFFPGDPGRYRDTTDVAVVLPELVQVFQGLLHAGVVADEDGPALQARYGFQRWPALVFVHAGNCLGSISGIQSWADYLHRIRELVAEDDGPVMDRGTWGTGHE